MGILRIDPILKDTLRGDTGQAGIGVRETDMTLDEAVLTERVKAITSEHFFLKVCFLILTFYAT